MFTDDLAVIIGALFSMFTFIEAFAGLPASSVTFKFTVHDSFKGFHTILFHFNVTYAVQVADTSSCHEATILFHMYN